jgi:phage portal protein BeeE
VVELRRDTLDSLNPWMTVPEQTLSLNDRASMSRGLITPRGIAVKFDVDAYTRDSPLTRMQTWEVALRTRVLSESEVRDLEPLAPTGDPIPTTSPDVVPTSQAVGP